MIGIVAVFVIALVGGLGTGWLLSRVFPPRGAPRTLNTAPILTQIQGLAQLVTVKYVIEKVVVFEDVRLYGENRVLLVAHGVVKAGVDLARLGPNHVQVRSNRVEITLPPASITDVYLDEDKTEVLEHSTGLLRRFDKNLEQNARREGLDAIRRAARYSGILDDATTRAQQQLRLLFLQLGYQDVQFQ